MRIKTSVHHQLALACFVLGFATLTTALITGSIKTTAGQAAINKESNVEFDLRMYKTARLLKTGDAIHLRFPEDFTPYFS